MSRPKFPTGTILTPEIIRRIREDQECYDRDPEDYERREREAREEYEREQEALREEERRFYERQRFNQ